MSDYQVIARRYRPQTFAEILGQDAIITTLKNAILRHRLAHAYLFCGSRGTGKTTLARVFAKALNCQSPTPEGEPCNICSSCKEITSGNSLDVLEIDGASHRGIDDIRQINDTVSYASSSGKFKIYIIDEVHMLTKEAFNALLKTLEEPPPQVKFFFATTEPHKVLPTILSRCQRFNLNRIPLDKITQKLNRIAAEQNRVLDEQAVKMIAVRAEGAFRDAESLLDQIFAFHDGDITAATVSEVLGLMPQDVLFSLDAAGKNNHLNVAFEVVDQLYSKGKDLSHFIEMLLDHFRTLLLIKLSGKDAPFLTLSAPEREKYAQSAALYTREQCLTAIDLLVEAQTQIRFSPSPRFALEALLLRILQLHQRISIDFLVRRLHELEKSVANPSNAIEASSPFPTGPTQPNPPASTPPSAPTQPNIPPQPITPTPLPPPDSPIPAPAPTPPPPDSPIPAPAPTPPPPDSPTPPLPTTLNIAEGELKIVPIHEIPKTKEKQKVIENPAAAPSPAPYSMTEDPTPSLADIGKKQPAIKSKPSVVHAEQAPELVTKSLTGNSTTFSPAKNGLPSTEPAIHSIKKQSRYDTLLQFASVELEGALQKKINGGF